MENIRDTRKKLITDLTLVTFGNGVGALLGFGGLVVVSHILSPSDFGLFAIVITLMTVVVSATDFGIPTTATRFASACAFSQPGRAAAFLKASFLIRITSSLIVMVLGVLFAAPIAEVLLKNVAYAGVVRIAFFGTLAISIGSFGNAIFQTWQQFGRLATYAIFANASRLIIICALGVFGSLGIYSGIFAYSLAPFLGATMVFFAAPRRLFQRSTAIEKRGIYSKIIHFNKWLGVAFLCDSIAIRLNLLVLSYLRGTDEVAIFAVALNVSLVLPIIIVALLSTLLPRVSLMHTRSELWTYIKHSVSVSTGIGILFIPFVIFSSQIVEMIFGIEYSASGVVMRILIIGFIINLIVNPLYTILYPLNKTRAIAALSVPNLIGMVLLTFFLAPNYGASGAAYSYLITTSAWAVLMVFVVAVSIAKMPTSQAEKSATAPTDDVPDSPLVHPVIKRQVTDEDF